MEKNQATCKGGAVKQAGATVINRVAERALLRAGLLNKDLREAKE